MISVEFRSFVEGTCGWCRKDKEVYHVAFSDRSFVGPMCKADSRAIGMKVGEPARPEQKAAVAVPVGNGAAAAK